MFGYIKPFKPQMRIIEFDTYKSFYCGLCKEMGRKYGLLSRMTLSYDFSFLAMMASAVNGEAPKCKVERCLFNPLKKKNCCCSCNELEFCADVAMIMFYYKVMDNISDENFFKRIMWYLILPYAKSVHKKASLSLPDVNEAIKTQIEKQAILEKEKCRSIDIAAEPTANSLAFVFSKLSDDEMQKRVLHRLGYFLGKYVYLCDAIDDIKFDFKAKGYNPFILAENLVSIENNEVAKIVENSKYSVYLTIGEAIKAYDLLDVKAYKPILDNVFNLGLRSTIDTIEYKIVNSKKK